VRPTLTRSEPRRQVYEQTSSSISTGCLAREASLQSFVEVDHLDCKPIRCDDGGLVCLTPCTSHDRLHEPLLTRPDAQRMEKAVQGRYKDRKISRCRKNNHNNILIDTNTLYHATKTPFNPQSSRCISPPPSLHSPSWPRPSLLLRT
jgi:hypothetical protein